MGIRDREGEVVNLPLVEMFEVREARDPRDHPHVYLRIRLQGQEEKDLEMMLRPGEALRLSRSLALRSGMNS